MELTALCEVVRGICVEMLEKHGFVPPVAIVVHGNRAQSDFPPVVTWEDRERLWTVLRKIAREDKPDAIVYGDTAMCIDIARNKFKGLTEEQQMRFCSMGAQFLAEYGYGRPQESLVVSAQSEHSYVSVLVPFRRTDAGIVWEEPAWRNAPQSSIGLENATKFFSGEVTQ